MSKKAVVPARAFKFVRAELHEMLIERVKIGHWDLALSLAESENRLQLCMALWRRIPPAERAAVLANAISGGDLPVRVWVPLNRALLELHAAGQFMFDGEAAHEAYEALPDTVTIYRGTVQAEVDQWAFGVCWTLDRGRAIWFAASHGRFRNTRSPPVLLQTQVAKASISGLLFDREEREVIIATKWIYESKPVAEPIPPAPPSSETSH